MTLFVVTAQFTNGGMVVGVYSTIDQAKAAAEYIAESDTPEAYGLFCDAMVQEYELDRIYSGEDFVPTHEYQHQVIVIPWQVN